MKLILTLLLMILGCMSANSQVPELRFKYFSKEDGIFSSFVNHLTQDSTGFIWIATREGLYRYDGYGFRGYFITQGDSTSISGNYVNCVYTDSQGILWIGTTSGICRYNEEYDNFIRVAHRQNAAGLNSLSISQIEEDRNHVLLINTGSTLYKYQEKENKFVELVTLTDAQINHFKADQYNRILLACSQNKGLVLFDPLKKSLQTLVSGLNVSKIAVEESGIWLSTMGGGVQRFEISTGAVTKFAYNNHDDALSFYIYADRDNNIWSVDYTGLKLANRQTHSLTGYYPQSYDPYSIKANLKGIYQDRQGNYWIYHEPGGVGISMHLKGFRHFGNNPLDFWHTSPGNVVSLHEDNKGNLWQGFYEGGIDVFDWQNGKITRFRYDKKNKYSLGRGSVLCIFRDSHGIMWIGTYFDGLQYYDEKTNRFISFQHDPADPNSLASNDVRSIAEDEEGNLWLAIHSKGIDKLDPRTGEITHFNNARNKLSNDWTFQLLFDHRGDLWVATAWGLNLLEKGKNIFRSFISDPNDTLTISGDQVTSLYQDGNDAIWVGTSTGLNKYNRKTNTFKRYSNVFESNFITGISSDRDNILWISNQSGIAMIDTEKNRIRNFNTSDGLLSPEYNVRSLYKSGKNEFFFGGTKGIDLFKPEELVFNNVPPIVVIDKFMIMNKEITYRNSDKLSKDVSFTDKVILDHSDKVISIGFKALNFINPEYNQYAYKLEGFDKTWNAAGYTKEAIYTNLNPGRYVFRVKASNNDGVWNDRDRSLVIIVKPPWYSTLIFKFLMICFVVVLVYVIIQMRMARLYKQQILLENTVKEKTAELQRNNANKDKLFSIIAHDLINPFNTIIGFSEVLKHNYNTIKEEDRIRYIDMIHLSSERVFSLLNSLLLWSRSQTNRISYQPENIKVSEVIREAVELNREQLKAKQMKASIDCDDHIHVWADHEMLKIIIRNLLNNAIKYTPKMGSINFSAKYQDGFVAFSVSDSGIGISKEKIDELLTSDQIRSERGTEGEAGSGLGLTLCKDFIKRNRGELHISGIEGKGTTFSFLLPSKKE